MMPGAHEDPLADDPLLFELVIGARSVQDPLVRRRSAEDPEFARALAEFERLQAKLERVGSQEREIVAAATAAEVVPPRRRRLWALVVPGVAAAAALLLLWPHWGRGPARDPLAQLRGRLLSASDFTVRRETTDEGDWVRWDLEAGLGWFDVLVLELLEDGAERPVFEAREVLESELLLPPSAWEATDRPVLIRIEQRVAGVPGVLKQGSLLLAPGD